MSFNTSFNKNYFSKVSYLDGKTNNTDYADDLTAIINNDISASNIYTDLSGLNGAFHSYLNSRNSGNNIGVRELDNHLLIAYKSNNDMIKQLTKHKINKYKQLHNLQQHLLDTSGNIELVTTILDGSGEDIHGEIGITQDKIDDINEDINIKARHLEVNTYYEKKYLKQQRVLKNVVILLCIILAISFLFKAEILGEKVFIACIGIMIAFSVIYLSYEIYDIFMRDNHNFDEYKYYTRESPSTGFSDEEKDKVDIPLELRAKIPGYCKLKDKYLNNS